MIALKEIYRCALCGNVIEAVYSGEGDLSCCGQPMLLLENDPNADISKHLPVITSVAGGTEVNVGVVEHPMALKHYIAFIEVVTKDDMVLRAELKPDDKPKAFFPVPYKNVLYVREYCNLHGLWKAFPPTPDE